MAGLSLRGWMRECRCRGLIGSSRFLSGVSFVFLVGLELHRRSLGVTRLVTVPVSMGVASVPSATQPFELLGPLPYLVQHGHLFLVLHVHLFGEGVRSTSQRIELVSFAPRVLRHVCTVEECFPTSIDLPGSPPTSITNLSIRNP